MQEHRLLQKDPPEMFVAAPLDDNIFEWHFTIQGGDDTPYAGGLYHGRILLPPQYPHKPPDVVFLTPNGRFEVNKKICLSITGYHPETWHAAWDIRHALTALIAFMPTPPNGAIGALNYSDREKRILAKRSRSYRCAKCGLTNREMLPVRSPPRSRRQSEREPDGPAGGESSEAEVSAAAGARDGDGKAPCVVADTGVDVKGKDAKIMVSAADVPTRPEPNALDQKKQPPVQQDQSGGAADGNVAEVRSDARFEGADAADAVPTTTRPLKPVGTDVGAIAIVLLAVLIAVLLARKLSRANGVAI